MGVICGLQLGEGDAHRILVEKPEGKRSLWKDRYDNIKINLSGNTASVDWI